jgi:HD-like signal output (HDOD) protein
VGKLAIAFACGEHFNTIRQTVEETKIPWRVAEHQVLGFDHTQVGAALLESWQFPESLVEVAKFYPQPSLAKPEHFQIVTHIHASKHLAVGMGVGVGEEGFSTELDEAALDKYGFNEQLVEECMPKILAEAERMFRNLH